MKKVEDTIGITFEKFLIEAEENSIFEKDLMIILNFNESLERMLNYIFYPLASKLNLDVILFLIN